jgi:hypothetical protein
MNDFVYFPNFPYPATEFSAECSELALDGMTGFPRKSDRLIHGNHISKKDKK